MGAGGDARVRGLREVPLFAELEQHELKAVATESRDRHVAAGAEVVRRGSPGTAVFALHSGRLRAFVPQGDGSEAAVGDIGPGELVGEMSLLTGEPRGATVRAVRDSRLIEVPADIFTRHILGHPKAAVGLARLLADRLDRANRGRRAVARRRTIAVLPAADAGRSLVESVLAGIERSADVRAVRASDVEGRTDAEITEWLHRVELESEVMVYVGEAHDTPWTQRALRQADHVVVVDAEVSMPIDERLLTVLQGSVVGPVSPTLDVVIVHTDARMPTGGERWTSRPIPLRVHHMRARSYEDQARIGRIFTHQDRALVLSGGGARGMVHVGILRAFDESGIPVDAIGGTSFGAIIAGYRALGLDWQEIRDELWRTVGKPGAPVDMTLPAVAISKGKKLMAVLESSFGDRLIENLWIRMFAVSSNLNTGHPQVHTTGSLRMALRASVAIPGVFPPVANEDGEVLIDGGIMNNLPIDVMERFADSGPIIAVNLRSPTVMATEDLPDDGIVPGLRTLLRRMSPFSENPSLPNLAEVLLRSTETGASLAARVLESRADYVMHPPIGHHKLLEFEAIDDLISAGYDYAMTTLAEWEAQGGPLT